MENKSAYIRNYINKIRNTIESKGISILDRQYEELINNFANSNKSIESIKEEIDALVKEFLERNELLQKSILQPEEVKSLQDIPVNNIGITLNSQQIDLMMIANSNNLYELQEVLSKTTVITEPISTLDMNEKEFAVVRQNIFDKYISSLQKKENSSAQNKSIGLLDYLLEQWKLSDDERNKVEEIIEQSSSSQEIMKKLMHIFDKNSFHNVSEEIRQYLALTEKVGITKTSLQGYRNLYQELQENYNSITIDNEVKYSSVVLLDNTFEFEYLKKTLDFAKNINKDVKLNALCFYADFPLGLSDVNNDEKGKQLIKETLLNYIDGVTKFIGGYNHENGNIIKNIDVFNELLNNFPIDGDLPYKYRGNIPQSDKFDVNTFAGWQKYLSIEDLCDVISVARNNLKDTGIVFTYNEVNLEDTKKIESLKEIMSEIKKYEQENGIKLVDSIGTQMHVNCNVTKEKFKQELIELGKIGYPIEITEFDMMIPPEVSSNLTLEQIENMKQSKLNDLCDVITECYQQVNLNGVTIWSVNDEQNFMIEVENRKLLNKGKTPNIDTVYGGYYSKDMLPRYEEYIKSKSKNTSNLTEQNREKNNQSSYTITPNQIGKKSIYVHIGKKDIAKGVVDRKVEERTNPQKLAPHNHNGSYGGTNDGR